VDTSGAAATIWGVSASDCFGWALAAGDLDASGGDDLAFSTLRSGNNRVYLYYSPFSSTE
jgi:hypothetical protein